MSGDLRNSTLLQNIRVMLDSLNEVTARGITVATTQVNRAAVRRLSGSRSAAPWTYPVPVRSQAGLRASQSFQGPDPANPYTGYVFNTAPYAAAIHSGSVSEWAGRGRHRMASRPARPFMDDAVSDVQPLMVIQREIEQGWLPQWT